jgi:hypothetical protein
MGDRYLTVPCEIRQRGPPVTACQVAAKYPPETHTTSLLLCLLESELQVVGRDADTD